MKIQKLSKIALIVVAAGIMPSLAIAQVPGMETLTEVVSAGPVPTTMPWDSRTAIGSASEQPSAHTRCLSGEAKRKYLGGGAGAVVGGLAGRKIAKKGDRTKGTVVGAAIGGLAGYGIADKTVDCDPVYETRNDTSVSHTQYSPYETNTNAPTVYRLESDQQASTVSHPDRIYVSNHPVYSNPSWGATTTPVYSNTASSYGANSNVIHASNTTHYAYSAPRVVRHSDPVPTGYMSQTAAPVTYRVMNTRPHHHGKYACTEQH